MNLEIEKPFTMSEEDLSLLTKEELIEIIKLKDDFINKCCKFSSESSKLCLNQTKLLEQIKDELNRKINYCSSENAEPNSVCNIQVKFYKRLLDMINVFLEVTDKDD